MEKYRYSPLTTQTSIRLFRVDRRDDFGIFHCSLKIVDLQDNPWDHAFSYTWGNPHPETREGHAFAGRYLALEPEYAPEAKKSIICDGKLIQINRNLYDALGDIPKKAWSRYIDRKNDKRGWTRLHIYVISGAVDMVQQTLCSNVDLNATDDISATALNWAARIGRLDIVKLLVEAGADIEIANTENQTALDYARALSHSEMVAYLEKARSGTPKSPAMSTTEGPEIWAWIDQICINQEDLDERCSQVSIMHEIYSKSQFTLIWLGREDEYTRSAVSTIGKLVQARDSFVGSDIQPYVDNSEETYKKAGLPYISEQEWVSLAALFQRQYFRRLWVVQENILSNLIVAYCGGIEIPWKDFCSAAMLLHLKQKRMGFQISSIYVPLDEASRGIEQPIVQLASWKELWQSSDEDTNLRRVSQENLVVDT